MSYTPEPIDTSEVQIPDGLADLVERLAENAHEVWARQRMADGWTYGPRRDDEARQHPDLVPYGDLTETEKEYDRQVVSHTIKAILSLGYGITRE